MKSDTKYYISQLIAIPAIGLPTVAGGIFFGGLVGKLAGAEGEMAVGVICLAVAIIIARIASLITGNILEKIKLLPQGASRVYPNALSWGDYLKKVEPSK